VSSSSTLLGSTLLQAAGAVLGVLATSRLARSHGRRFLRHWARAWAWRATACALAAAEIAVAAGMPSVRHPLRLALVALGSLAAYLEIAYFAFGAGELAVDGSATVSRRNKALGFAVGVGALSAVALAWNVHADSARFFVQVGAPSLLLCVVLAGAAVAAWHTPRREDAVGRLLVASVLGALALAELRRVWAGVVPASPDDWGVTAGIADLLLSAALALCLTIFLLEEQTEGARATAADVERLSRYDELTGLHNRRFLLESLHEAVAQARRAERRVALFLLDLDRFKLINESLGHAVGDRILHAVGERLRGALRDGDTIARMPGDEFAVLAPAVREADDAVNLARKIQEAVRVPVRLDGRELFVTASLGISLYPDDGDSAESLLKHADAALTRAKADGPDLFQLYTARMNAAAVEAFALEHALRRAVNARELELYYQPIVDTEWNDVQIVEATLRWHHPELGLLRPAHFLGVAEATGLIVAIGAWALREACRQLRAWRIHHPTLRVTVNLSLRQLRQADVAEEIGLLLTEFQLPGDALELEIAELTAAQCDAAMVGRLKAIRQLGVRIAIDDFGTGWTSLGVLREFPVDTLKIDTSFVRDLLTSPRDGEIAAAVVGLAHALGLTVVAEGVENPAQLELLKRRGCELWQGYLCCPPVTATDVARVLGRKLGIGKIVANEGGGGASA
jgi:diguanylate cyclase (GGDEF)-like protein